MFTAVLLQHAWYIYSEYLRHTKIFYTLYGQRMVKTNYEKSYRYIIKSET
jgi:hypothetical protein